MSTMTTTRITPGDLGSIPRKTAVIVCELVNEYGVTYRMQNNGGHLYLYNGAQKERPYKISASRPEETTLKFLMKWIEENVPAYLEGKEKKEYTMTVSDDALVALQQMVSTTEHQSKPKVVSTAEKMDTNGPVSGWNPYKYGFEVMEDSDGTHYRCAFEGCDYTRDGDAKGLHLHEAAHDPEFIAERARRGGVAAGLARQQKKILATEAVRALAGYHGMEVIEKGADTPEVTKLREEIERLKQELDDTKARLSLIRDAMRA